MDSGACCFSMPAKNLSSSQIAVAELVLDAGSDAYAGGVWLSKQLWHQIRTATTQVSTGLRYSRRLYCRIQDTGFGSAISCFSATIIGLVDGSV